MENLSKVELGSSGSPKISGCNLDGDVSKVKDEFKFIWFLFLDAIYFRL